MPSLELAIQSQGVKQGGAETRSELDQIIQKGAQTEQAMGRISQTATTTGASMREAFGASRGGINLARGIQGVTDAFNAATEGSKSFATAGLAAAGVLTQISRTAEDWRNMSTAVTSTQRVMREAQRDVFGIVTGFKDVVVTQREVTTGFGALWGVMRANPVLAVAAGITTLSALMSAFAAATAKTASEWDKLGEAMQSAKLNQQAAAFLGMDQTPAMRQQLDQLFQATALSKRGETGTLGALATASGIGNAEVARFLAMQGDQRAMQYMQTGTFQLRAGEEGYRAPNRVDWPNTSANIGAMSLTGSQQQAFLAAAYRNLSRTIDKSGLPPDYSFPAAYEGYGPVPPGWKEPEVMGPQVPGGNYHKAKVEVEEMSQLARELHGTFADAGATFLMNLSQGRAILQDMVKTMATSILRTGISKVTEGLFDSFGRTATQAGNP